MELDIVIIKASHFTSKKDNKTYNTIDFILVNKENYIETDNFKGYSVNTSFTNENHLSQVPIMVQCKGIFDEKINGLRKNLVLKAIKYENKVIDLV